MKILVSSCLIGKPCRWHGKKTYFSSFLKNFLKTNSVSKIIDICPEMLGGLPTPRPPVKRIKGRVYETCADKQLRRLNTGKDVTVYFIKGAEKTLEIALKEKPDICILCKYSPSCDIQGITGSLLKLNNFIIINTF
ncbi:MAG: DUF523 domain-containing protein [Candidatus Methanofastidiosa archaeon]|nr:DUF523 domain-containing protein [Candidatus Methanofastidiosa archaeon]